MSKFKVLGLCIFLIISGCSRPPIDAGTTVETPPASPTPEPEMSSATPTLTATDVAQALSPTPTLPATVTPTSITSTPPSAPLKVQCSELLTTFPLDTDTIGFLVLTDEGAYGGWGLAGTFFLDIETGNRVPLVKQGASNHPYGFTVSPDRKWMVYFEKGRYIISGLDNQPLSQIPIEDTWLWIDGWQDNQHIWIEKRNDSDDPPFKHSRVLLNVVTLEQQEFPIIQYPDILYFVEGFLLYDPTLTMAAYTKATVTEGGLAIWDMLAERQVAHFTEVKNFNELPAWSSDGQNLAVGFTLSAGTPIPGKPIYGNDIYQVDLEGQATRMTYLSDYYSNSEIGRLAWSPDNRYIAFELNAEPVSYPEYADIDARGPRLAVLDTQTGQVTNYCIPLGANGSQLIWSPDSRQIVVQNQNVSNAKGYVLWIDIEAGVAAKIAEDMTPVGWLASP